MAAFRRVIFVPVVVMPPGMPGLLVRTAAAEEQETPDEEAWLATSRRVCESYSAGLAAADPAGLPNPVSRLNLHTSPAEDELAAGAAVTVEVHVDRVWEGGEFAHVRVPHGIARLAATTRSRSRTPGRTPRWPAG